MHEWYLSVYVDAFEWVEAPNTIGMSQFADGGVVGSKPYVSSGAYIDRMSDYCGGCAYRVKEKTGERACPFNLLYWHFLARHRERFRANPRMGQMYRVWDGMDEGHRESGAGGGGKGACAAGRGRGGLSPCGRWVNPGGVGAVGVSFFPSSLRLPSVSTRGEIRGR